MMTKSVLADKLLHLGINPAHAGFTYMVDYLCILDKTRGAPPRVMAVYKEIADERSTTAANIERCLRHAISVYYDTHDEFPDCLRPYVHSGSMAVHEFVSKLHHLFREDTGYLPDGSCWTLTEVSPERYTVRVYRAGGNYTACRGTHDECIKFITEERERCAV